MLEEFGILDKVSLTVTDNEPKMNLCYPSFERSGCLCHIEHSSISKGSKKMMRFTALFKRSEKFLLRTIKVIVSRIFWKQSRRSLV